MKHDAQFQFLKPVNGFITGEQARIFFLKSGLPPMVLGQIWFVTFYSLKFRSLADITGDGKMDKKEFSIAMLLVKKKLEGMSLPNVLPASLKGEPKVVFSTSVSLGGLQTLSLNTLTSVPASNGQQNSDWSIPPNTRPRYKLQFNQHDKIKKGFLTGNEARSIFIRSGLSQNTLAQIWYVLPINLYSFS
ncbi:unnamed protein product [Protopolystoma xenopodis]|uniref:EH domain-containing protein n=1 Tax=Protopolystoma xenopodis TaxID=117903 RepID=A0A3S5B2E7_9PLAT|nr:unnamed protein product [Protopolystoma xenopodis]